MNDEAKPKTPPQLEAVLIPLWQQPEERKRISQTITRLKEWRGQLKDAQAFVLSRTAEEFKDRQAAIFVSNIGGVDLAITLLEVSHAGMILAPEGWGTKD